jgi:polyhydroxybutyrate depolymerase
VRRTAIVTLLVALVGALVGAFGSASVGAKATITTSTVHRLDIGNVTRTYRLHVPRNLTAGTAVPLVIVLHGATATAAEVEGRYHWDPHADRDRFVVAYPQGVADRWNDRADPSLPDDVAFLGKLIDDVERHQSIDPARVYVTGISNGGLMTYRAACALGDRLAAIGPVAAWFPDCLPSTPVPVLHIHGLLDDQLGYGGGNGYPSVEKGLAEWRAVDGCPTTTQTTSHGQVTTRTWAPCAGAGAVELITITKGEHEWPGAVPKLGNERVSHAIDATSVIWAFFRAHTR